MNRKHNTSGFTLIEMIVSLALFSVVITISVGALLTLIASNRQLQDEQAVLTNLSFALDSMSREIRTGTSFYCDSRPNTTAGGPNNIFGRNIDGLLGTANCLPNTSNQRLRGITVIESGNSITGTNERLTFFYDSAEQALYRRVGNDTEQITSAGIAIVDAQFVVTGSSSLGAGGDTQQPTVTIYLEAQIEGETNPKTYPLQTTVVQRTLDL